MTNEQAMLKEKALAEELWLLYYNDYLFKNGFISEAEKSRMISKIYARTSKRYPEKNQTR